MEVCLGNHPPKFFSWWQLSRLWHTLTQMSHHKATKKQESYGICSCQNPAPQQPRLVPLWFWGLWPLLGVAVTVAPHAFCNSLTFRDSLRGQPAAPPEVGLGGDGAPGIQGFVGLATCWTYATHPIVVDNQPKTNASTPFIDVVKINLWSGNHGALLIFLISNLLLHITFGNNFKSLSSFLFSLGFIRSLWSLTLTVILLTCLLCFSQPAVMLLIIL